VALLDRYDSFLFDLDGVLYRGTQPVEGAPEALRALRDAGKRVAFVTNNSARRPEIVAERLRSVGVEADASEVETSAMATADLLGRRGIATAFVVGEEGVRSALTESGIAVLDGEPDRAEVVVVGFDTTADYAKLRTACILVERGAALVATNGDGSFPAADGTRWPGAGALLAAIVATTDAEPEVVGKPNAPLFLAALERAGGGRPLVVGDRLDTDIAGAAALGWDCLLVLTGISTREEADASPMRPTFVGDDLSILLR
jgi:HAD superfamily hydrolase (TIGR01457 family)